MVYALLEPMAVHVETKIRSRMKICPVLAGELQEALLDMLEEYNNARGRRRCRSGTRGRVRIETWGSI